MLKKSYEECLDNWGEILCGLVALIFACICLVGLCVGIYDTKGLLLLIPLLIFGPPYLCYLWNNRKSNE